VTDLAAEERQRRLREQAQLVVKKAGIGQDIYPWGSTSMFLEHGVLMMRDDDEVLLHAYNTNAWLEVILEENP
jgi:hypothetical protein